VDYERDSRPGVLLGHLSNRAVTQPHRYHPHFLDSDKAEALVYGILNESGQDRCWIRAPGGYPPGDDVFMTFAAWHVLEDFQREALVCAIRRWRGEKRDRTVGVYVRREVSDPFVRVNGGLPPDPENPKVMEHWWQNFQPLLDAGVSEIGLDNSGTNDPYVRNSVIDMAQLMREERGAQVHFEAVPQLGDNPYDPPDWHALQYAPCIALWRFVWYRCLRHGAQAMQEWTADEHECHVLMEHGRDNPSGFSWPEPTRKDVKKLESMGWIISWNLSTFEITS
jgi:hypothetical protein